MHRSLLFLVLAFTSAIALADEGATQLLDQDVLTWETVHGDGRIAPLALSEAGKPLVALLRIPKGGVLKPHAGKAQWHLITVVRGTLSYADGDRLEEGKLVDYPPGSVLVLPRSTMHYAMARQDDVLLQVTLIHQGSLTPDVSSQVVQPGTTAAADSPSQAAAPERSAL